MAPRSDKWFLQHRFTYDDGRDYWSVEITIDHINCKNIMLKDFDKSRFAVRIPVKASVEKIFRSWNTPGGLEHFFLRQALFHSPEGMKREAEDAIEA